MKSFQVPILSTSLLGLCLLSGLGMPPAHADFIFGEPINLGPPINTAGGEASPYMSSDGLELYIDSDRPGGYGGWDLWVARRATTEDTWGEPVNLGPSVNGSSIDYGPAISADGLELYFTSARSGNWDIYVAERATVSGPWGQAVNVGSGVNSPYMDLGPSISADGLELFFCSTRPGGSGAEDLWVVTRPTIHEPWGNPANLGAAVNSPYIENSPHISPDGLLLLFESLRPSGYGAHDIWVTRRATKNDSWGPAVNLGPSINTSFEDFVPGISPDGRQFYFVSTNRPGGLGGYDIWQAPIVPTVDFNGDGKVDGKDVLYMVAHWGTDDPLCDIGPFAWGDGIVGLEDLTVLAGYLGKDVSDPTLIAHWALDETEGTTAHDSVSSRADIILGSPLWQPTGGQVDGALQLNGVSDCIVSSFALNPAKGPFSVLAWVKGGAPGQVVLSEPGLDNWLKADAEGKLRTELQGSGRDGVALQSQTIITDGKWHRIGLVWDGSRRMLYVDGVVAAEDTQTALPISGNGLYIGTGKAMELGTFWSGLIDDVRIYSRAVRP